MDFATTPKPIASGIIFFWIPRIGLVFVRTFEERPCLHDGEGNDLDGLEGLFTRRFDLGWVDDKSSASALNGV